MPGQILVVRLEKSKGKVEKGFGGRLKKNGGGRGAQGQGKGGQAAGPGNVGWVWSETRSSALVRGVCDAGGTAERWTYVGFGFEPKGPLGEGA